MKLFIGINYYTVAKDSEDPGKRTELIYYIGNISDTWRNFISIHEYRIQESHISNWNNVEEIK